MATDEHGGWRLAGARIHQLRTVIDAEIALGTVTVLIGPSGAGKSTVLQALGAIPYLPGEEERSADVADVTWYLRPGDPEAFAEGLLPGHPEAAQLGGALLVAYRAGHPITVAVNVRTVQVRRLLDRHVHTPRSERGQVAALLRRAADAGQLFAPLPIPAAVHLPAIEPTTVWADANDVSPLLTRRLARMLHELWDPLAKQPHIAAALKQFDHDRLIGPLVAAGMLQPLLATINSRLTAVVPPFLAASGERYTVGVHDGVDSPAGRAFAHAQALSSLIDEAALPHLVADLRELRAALRAFHDTADNHLDVTQTIGSLQVSFSRLGAGNRRWLSAAIQEVCRELTRELRAHRHDTAELTSLLGSDTPLALTPTTSPPRLMLVDEPSNSVEPRAQQQVLRWLLDTVSRNPADSLVVSTHDTTVLASFSDLPRSIVLVTRHQGRTRLRNLDEPVLDGLSRNLRELGLAPEEVLMQARGLLLVEGMDDKDVIERIWRHELRQRGILVRPAGSCTARVLQDAIDNDIVRALDVPIWILLDKIPNPDTEPDHRFPTDVGSSPEERDLAVALKYALQRNLAVRSLPFEGPDLLAAFSEEFFGATVGMAVPARTWPNAYGEFLSWKASTGRSVPFKAWTERRVRNEAGLPDSFHMMRTLCAAAEAGTTSRWIDDTMERLFTEFDSLPN